MLVAGVYDEKLVELQRLVRELSRGHADIVTSRASARKDGRLILQNKHGSRFLSDNVMVLLYSPSYSKSDNGTIV